MASSWAIKPWFHHPLIHSLLAYWRGLLLTDENNTKALCYRALELFAVWPLLTAGLVGPVEDPLHEKRVHVDEGRLEQVQSEHGDLLVLAVGAGEVAVLAVEEGAVGAVPV